jgi:hypothetical protein
MMYIINIVLHEFNGKLFSIIVNTLSLFCLKNTINQDLHRIFYRRFCCMLLICALHGDEFMKKKRPKKKKKSPSVLQF